MTIDLWPRATVTRRIRKVARDADDLLARISEVTDGQADSEAVNRKQQTEASDRPENTIRQADAVLSGTH